jgi:hypothetical protein
MGVADTEYTRQSKAAEKSGASRRGAKLSHPAGFGSVRSEILVVYVAILFKAPEERHIVSLLRSCMFF